MELVKIVSIDEEFDKSRTKGAKDKKPRKREANRTFWPFFPMVREGSVGKVFPQFAGARSSKGTLKRLAKEGWIPNKSTGEMRRLKKR